VVYNKYYKPSEEEKKKFCQNPSDGIEGNEGFPFCPRYRAYQDYLKNVKEK